MPMTPPPGFLTIAKQVGMRADKPTARFSGQGILLLSARLHESLGLPERVYIYLNPETRQIALGPADRNAADARKLNLNNIVGNTRRLNLAPAYRQAGWHPRRAEVIATITDGLAFLDVPADETSPNGR